MSQVRPNDHDVDSSSSSSNNNNDSDNDTDDDSGKAFQAFWLIDQPGLCRISCLSRAACCPSLHQEFPPCSGVHALQRDIYGVCTTCALSAY